MRAGSIAHVIELQRVSVVADSHGDQVKTWTTLATVRAAVEPLSGREFLAAAQVMADLTTKIKIRGRRDITLTPKDRVLWGTRTFDIRHIVDWGGKGVNWDLLCTERF